MRLIPKELETLWTLFTGPVVWALHFLACYAAAAIHCAKGSQATFSFGMLRLTLAMVTILALGAILAAGWLAWRQWGFGSGDPPHDEPTREDRQLFQGFATLLLSGLSFIAVIFVSIPLLLIEACVR
ncbi:hypothetical protein [Pararhizobium sp. O133]|uniref:hypothetical protein n=1 Tax=Pararhizobium sp. O133 TaxID=3449278 RepID=UPI003F68917B